MSWIRRSIGKIIFPQLQKFYDDLNDSFLVAVREIDRFETPFRKLCQNWLAVFPRTYLSELFLEKENWNKPFYQAFNMHDAKICFKITQAFCSGLLFRVVRHDKSYLSYPVPLIKENIQKNFSSGGEIIESVAEFEIFVRNISTAEDLSMWYVEKILKTQYNDFIKIDSILSSILAEYESIYALTVFTAESINRIKEIDKNFPNH